MELSRLQALWNIPPLLFSFCKLNNFCNLKGCWTLIILIKKKKKREANYALQHLSSIMMESKHKWWMDWTIYVLSLYPLLFIELFWFLLVISFSQKDVAACIGLGWIVTPIYYPTSSKYGPTVGLCFWWEKHLEIPQYVKIAL